MSLLTFFFRPGRYDFEQVEGKPAFYNIRMKLKIHNVSESDFGIYRCLAKNSQGETTGDIELYGNNIIKNKRTSRLALFLKFNI